MKKQTPNKAADKTADGYIGTAKEKDESMVIRMGKPAMIMSKFSWVSRCYST